MGNVHDALTRDYDVTGKLLYVDCELVKRLGPELRMTGFKLAETIDNAGSQIKKLQIAIANAKNLLEGGGHEER